METLVETLNTYVQYTCQILAIFVICTGIVKALWTFVKDALFDALAAEAIKESRLELGHAFSLGLGFLIGSSILSSSISPSWDDIGKLAAVIVIRTVLNYFLLQEIKNHNEDEEKKN